MSLSGVNSNSVNNTVNTPEVRKKRNAKAKLAVGITLIVLGVLAAAAAVVLSFCFGMVLIPIIVGAVSLALGITGIVLVILSKENKKTDASSSNDLDSSRLVVDNESLPPASTVPAPVDSAPEVDELELKSDLEQSDITIRTLQLWEHQKNQILRQLSEDDPNLSLINDYSTIIRSIINELQSAGQNNPEPTGGERWDRIVKYSDATGKLQLIALYNSIDNKLAYLITNIDNLRLDTNKNQTRGNARTLINHLIELSKEVRRDLTLSSTKTAIPFYEKLGFKRISDGPLEGPVPMIYKVS